MLRTPYDAELVSFIFSDIQFQIKSQLQPLLAHMFSHKERLARSDGLCMEGKILLI